MGERRTLMLGGGTEVLFTLAAVSLVIPVFPPERWFGWAALAATVLAAVTVVARTSSSSALVPLWTSVSGLLVVGIITMVVTTFTSPPGRGGIGPSVVQLLQQGADQIVNEAIPVTPAGGLAAVLIIATCLVLVLVQMVSTDVRLPAATGLLAIVLSIPGIAFDQIASPGTIIAVALAYVLLLLTHATPAVRRHGIDRRESAIARRGTVIASVLAIVLALGAPTLAATSGWWARAPSIMSMFKPGAQGQVSNILDVGVPNRDRSRALVGTVPTNDGSSPGVVRSYTTATFSGRTWTAPTGVDDLDGFATTAVDQNVAPGALSNQLTEMTFDLPSASRAFAPIPQQQEPLGIIGLGFPWRYSPKWGLLARPSPYTEALHYEVHTAKTEPTADQLRATGASVSPQPTSDQPSEVELVFDFNGVTYDVWVARNVDTNQWVPIRISPSPADLAESDQEALSALIDHQLADLGPVSRRDSTGEYTHLPSTLDPSVKKLAQQIVAGADTDYDKALALQNYFRGNGFIYDRSIATVPDNQDPVAAFLKTKRGYCTQYATTMIMMARALGLPARLGVGYLVTEQAHDGTWRIGSENAHAWPEIAFGDRGWVRFEPTPATHTGAAPDWAPETSAGASATPSAEQTPSATMSAAAPEASATASNQAGGSEQSTSRATWLLCGLAAAVVIGVFAAALIRRRTLAAATVPAVERAWQTVGKAARAHGGEWAPTKTPRRLVTGLAADLPDAAADALIRIETALEAERYQPHPLTSTSDPDTLFKDATIVAAAIRALPRTERRRTRWRPMWFSRRRP